MAIRAWRAHDWTFPPLLQAQLIRRPERIPAGGIFAPKDNPMPRTGTPRVASARSIRTPKEKAAFIKALSETASVTKACSLSSVSRTSVYQWRADDPEFLAAWDKALDLATDALEDEAIRRAVEGTDKPVYQGGELVGHVREYSDTLMIFMLKARRPEKFRERTSANLNLSGGLTLEQMVLQSMQPKTEGSE